MSKTVIVMRHGKAKRPMESQPDIDRELTEAGARALKATLEESLAMWPSSEMQTEIWASPAVRAQQTAELLSRALRKRGVATARETRIAECLWTGDAQTLLSEIAMSEADVIAVVGHNPFSETLVHDLTGSSIKFSTGGIAAVRISDCLESDRPGATDAACAPALAPNEPAARLLWFVQGPVSQRWKTLVNMETALGDAADTIRRRFDAFFQNPDDIETTHALRVSIRTARSLVAFVRPWQNSGQNDRIQGDLRSIVRLTSRLRELDVMWEQASSDESASRDLVDFCASQAGAERSAVLEKLGKESTLKRLERATGNLKSIQWKRRITETGLGSDTVRARFDQLAAELESSLDELDLAEVELTHDVRKQAKRVRYSAERFKDILGEDAIAIAKKMVAHQDELGAICDARVNIDIINSLASSDLPEPIAWELALLRARYETFLYTSLRNSHEKAGDQARAAAGNDELRTR